MKTRMFPGYAKLLGVVLLLIFLAMIFLAFTQAAHNLTASIGWHDLASVGWVT